MNPKIVFLTYNSRSGSTLLSKILSQYKEVGMGIEADIPDGMMYGRIKVNDKNELSNYLDILYKNEKFKGWKIPKRQLKEKLLQNHSFPIDFMSILCTALSLFFDNKSLKVWIHKNGHYIRFAKQILRRVPCAKFVYINRDPRAIYNSQKKSMNSQTGYPMHTNVGSFLHHYKVTQDFAEKFTGEEWFHLITYEKLVQDQNKEMDDLLRFLNVSSEKEPEGNYFEKIPVKQKHLHKNLEAALIIDNTNKWIKELKDFEIFFLQFYLKKELKMHSYIILDIAPLNIFRIVKFCYYSLCFYYLQVKMKIKNLVTFKDYLAS